MVCAVVGCNSGSSRYKGPKFTLYAFRTSPRMKQLWMEQINRKNFTPTKSSVVCGKHFAEDAFVPSMEDSRGRKRKRRQLKDFAIPTLFLRPSQMCNEESDSPVPSQVPDTSAAVAIADHSYVSNDGGEENENEGEGDHLSLDTTVQSEIIVGNDETQMGPIKQNPPQTSCRKCIDHDTDKEALLARIQQLEQKNADLQETVDKVSSIWNPDQVRLMMKPSKATVHFETKTILDGIHLYYKMGTTCYEFMRKKGHPLPSLSTLKRHLREVDCQAGILDDFLLFMKKQAENLEEHEKFCVLCIDEMSLKVRLNIVILVLVSPKLFGFSFDFI